MISLNNLFIHGRYHYDGNLYLYNTASGIEFNFRGKTASIIVKAEIGQSSEAWMRVIIDNDDKNALDVKFGASFEEIRLITCESEEIHNIKVLKVSEAIESHICISDLIVDGTFLNKPVYKNTFLVFGDSTVSAFGNLGNVDDIKTLDDTDGLKGFAYLTCKAFNASMNSLNGSGWGLSFSPWTIPMRKPLFAYYDKVAPMVNINYDMKQDMPSLAMISLGTNDYWYIFEGEKGKTKEDLLQEFCKDYYSLLKRINDDYPNIPIIMIYGTMKTTPNLDIMHNIYLDNKDKFNLHEVCVIGDALGVSTHPSASCHKMISEVLINKVKELI